MNSSGIPVDFSGWGVRVNVGRGGDRVSASLRRLLIGVKCFWLVMGVSVNCVAIVQEPCHDTGRAALLCRLDIGAVQQRSPTVNGFMGTRPANFRMGATHEQDCGLSHSAAHRTCRRHRLTFTQFQVLACCGLGQTTVGNMEALPTQEPCERCAAFMPLQCDISEGIRIVLTLLDVPTLRRNKFRDPIFRLSFFMQVRYTWMRPQFRSASQNRRNRWPAS